MISFPHCKVNIGLDVLRKRPDGYHDIETAMYPVRGLCDSLEIVPAADGAETPVLTVSGALPECKPQNNIVMKAWHLMHEAYGIGGVRMHLHKSVPSGAGLGGGSADGAFALRMLDSLFALETDAGHLERMALALGSDVPFFLHDAPQLCSGRGETMRPAPIDLKGWWMVLIKPAVSVSTAEAYAGITPRMPEEPLSERLAHPMNTWRETVANDFEPTIFAAHPELAAVKRTLYEAGARYASMSGSGSALYGLFAERPDYPAGEGVFVMRL